MKSFVKKWDYLKKRQGLLTTMRKMRDSLLTKMALDMWFRISVTLECKTWKGLLIYLANRSRMLFWFLNHLIIQTLSYPNMKWLIGNAKHISLLRRSTNMENKKMLYMSVLITLDRQMFQSAFSLIWRRERCLITMVPV